MPDFIERNESLINSLKSHGVLESERIIQAFQKVPRHLFVPEKYVSRAYHDVALPSLGGQTISQPYTVARMLEALKPRSGQKILDIGSGTGWTTCLLANIVGKKGKVIGIDIKPELFDFAKKNIRKTGMSNIELILGDARKGYPKERPYDSILINAACDDVPPKVRNQCKIGGRIVAPININNHQELTLLEKTGRKKFDKKNLGRYVFVELK